MAQLNNHTMAQMPEIKTLVWRQAEKLALEADVYIPSDIKPGEKRPIGIDLPKSQPKIS